MATVSAIACIGRRRELGKNGELIWYIPDDLKRFRSITNGHPIIMGRKTFESIGKPLPNRTNIVITTKEDWKAEGVEVVHSVFDAIKKATTLDAEEVFVIGGQKVFEEALPFLQRLHLTIVDGEAEADTFFPPFEHIFLAKTFEEQRSWNGLSYRWVDFEKPRAEDVEKAKVLEEKVIIKNNPAP